MRSEPKPVLINIRPTDEDWRIIVALKKRLGIGVSSVLRLALRRLYDAEKQQKQ